jgi:excisionase family DNA binding protein
MFYKNMDKLVTEPLMKPPEVARWLRLSAQVINRMACAGAIPAIRIGKSWRFNRDELVAWVESQKEVKP